MGRCEFCKATKKKNASDGISFHRFPKDPAQARLWLKNLGKENWQPHQFSVLCSAHFTPDCFKKHFNRSTLHEGRVPTIFKDGNKIVTHATEEISSTESFGEGGDVSNCQDVSMQETTGSNNAEGSWNDKHFNLSTLHEGRVPAVSDDENEIVTHATEEISSTESLGEGGDVSNCQDVSMQETTGSNSAKGSSDQENDIGAQSWRQFESEEDLGLLSSTIEAGPSETAAEASTCTATPKRRHYLNHDHSYEDSPTTTAKKLHLTKKKLFTHRKEIRVLRQRVKRLKTSVTSLKDVITKLKEVNLISESSSNALSAFEDVPLQVFSRMLRNHKKGTLSREKYPPDLRCFALTLHFYSPKAYDYVRQTFKLALPHPDVLRAWYSNVDAEPGFTEESFKALEFKVAEALEAGKEIVCALIMDEMGIKKGCQRGRDGKVRGHVDIGVGAEGGDDLMEANNCLVMLVVPLDSNWKLPVGYFLVRGLIAEEKSSLVTETLKRLHQVGVRVCSLTLDGPNDHFKMVHLLGANLEFKDVEPRPRFPHPVSTEPDIHVMLDPCHMLKNIRNCLAEYEVLLDDNNQSIKWDYIDKLARLQQKEGLRLANKLRLRHVDFKKEIMKVYLAAQTLSSSVADALEFCWEVLGLADFKGCQATVRFIRYVDMIFDFLNVRSPIGEGFKSPLRCANESVWRPRIMEAITYLSTVKRLDGMMIYHSRRKVGFIGFHTAVLSSIAVFDTYVKPPNSHLKYLLTYKMSQDHLELFFAAIRSRSGWCPNPTATQTVSAYKRLLVRHEVKVSTGNTRAMDNTTILFASSTKHARVDRYDESVYEEVDNMIVQTKYDLDESPDNVMEEFLHFPWSASTNLTEFSEQTIGYIAGFVVRSLRKKVKCVDCLVACVASDSEISNDLPASRVSRTALIVAKTRGGLIVPSPSVIKICTTVEVLFRRASNCNSGRPPHEPNFLAVLSTKAFQELVSSGYESFPDLNDHLIDSYSPDACGNHVISLTKKILSVYIEIRMFALTKNYALSVTGTNI